MLDYNLKLKKYSRKLRVEMTDAELLLWRYVRRKQIEDVQFYRQKPIGKYIVDFYAPAVNLVVELDGGQHFFGRGLKKDKWRDAHLTALELKILRFSNQEVLCHVGDVLNEIHRKVCERKVLR